MKNVGIICGGFSSEFSISVKSGTNIFRNFPNGYNPYLILLKKDGWFIQIDEEVIELDSTNLSFVNAGVKVFIDVAIVYIHGDPGENGKVQAYLEMINIPYVNSGPLASQLSFDKWYCNQFIKGFDLHVAESIYLTDVDEKLNYDSICNELGLPLFVKPCDSGSSFGISKVEEKSGLKAAIDMAFDEGRTVVIERFLKGTEVTCGVYRNKEGIRALALTEIVSHSSFFDYKAKYEGLSEEITPARINSELTEKVQSAAKRIYELLKLRSIARIDFMVVDEIPYVIEVNTTPGFSNESIVPKMIAYEGISVKEFWTAILEVEIAN